MQTALLLLALLGCPIAYIALVLRMMATGIEKPPIIPMFFLFGTVGGWFLVFGLYGMPAIFFIAFLFTVAPVALLVASLGICSMKNRTIYHNISMWSGFTYLVVLVLVAFIFLNQKAEQDETQQPLSAALFTCSPVISTSTP